MPTKINPKHVTISNDRHMVTGVDFAPFCSICGAAQPYEADHCETDEWQEADFCDQCGKAYIDKQRDPDCIGCGSIE